MINSDFNHNPEGISLADLAKEFGAPLYVYDGNKMISQYNRLRNAFPGEHVRIKYALKALNNPNILKLFRKQGAGLDAVSIHEVQMGLQAGFQSDEILFTPNCVSFDEIKAGVEAGVQINIDSISMLEHFGHHFGNSVPCCIRINPHIVAGGNVHIQTGHIDSKFGISIHQLRHVLRIVEKENIRVNGLHMHTGSDILDSGVFIQGAELLLETALSFKDLQFIDFGSGFKVAYKQDDVTTDIEELGRVISERFNTYCKEYGRQLELWFEPGKFLVSEAGFLLVKVNVIKQTTATVFAGVDSGQNHLIRPMFYDAYHHMVNISNPAGTPRIYTVVGYICETDTFGWDRKMAELREGDIIAICNAGAYGYTMSNNYNGRPRPAEVLLLDGKAHLIRKAETLNDLTRNVVDVGI
ncbi:MAG: diaminopimelate decarboxylase [Bacteroidia bacterium]|nr:diaminopimelate decarboxylase [Bacteroidota bacterium]MBP9083115.1 diaminopimelate decarboxylase [Bacteroidia bacterium]MBK7388945.1 diaminopimelate decarboxylase [Bacteroidota bacterium]MBK7968257.1 diaminopimelate decarboxylase [Bacteroidota bacterium]MBK8415826.1 diaminopimelate decarboxylase [Bacteroidota bacterium]